MKKILTLVLVAFIGGTAMAQDAPLKAKVESAEKFTATKDKGVFVFQMPSTVTAEQVKAAADYYTQYFTVNFDAKTKNAKITMVKNDEVSKHVIARFLITTGVKEITMSEKNYAIEAFYQEFIK